MIRSLRHKGIEAFFASGSKAGIQRKHAAKLGIRLFALDSAKHLLEMNAPGWGLHPLHGQLEGHWAVWVNGNWRLTFGFEGGDAILVDYH